MLGRDQGARDECHGDDRPSAARRLLLNVYSQKKQDLRQLTQSEVFVTSSVHDLRACCHRGRLVSSSLQVQIPQLNIWRVAMIVNDLYDSDVAERVMKQEAVLRERLLPELEWDETEDARVVEELLGRSNLPDQAS